MCLNASACRSAACEPDNRRCIRACDASWETSAPGPCGRAVSVDDCHGGRKKLSGEKRLIFQLPSVHARREGGGIGKELRGRARWCERSHRDAEMSRSINDELALHNSAQRQPRVRSRGMSSPRIAPRAIRATVSRPPLPHPGARMTPRIIVVPPSAETGEIARALAPAGYELLLVRGDGAELSAVRPARFGCPLCAISDRRAHIAERSFAAYTLLRSMVVFLPRCTENSSPDHTGG